MALTQKEQDYVDTNYADTDVATTVKDALSVGDDLSALTATAAELNALDGITASTAELNLMDGVTATTAELNIVDGVTSTATELNLLDESATEPADGAFVAVMRMAKIEYDFATDGGAVSAIDLGVTIPAEAIIVLASVEVITTATSSGDTATGAISVEGANDVVTAIAISDGQNPWDAGVGPLIVVDPTDASTHVKATVARQVTFTIAVEAFTAGKFNVHIGYIIGE